MNPSYLTDRHLSVPVALNDNQVPTGQAQIPDMHMTAYCIVPDLQSTQFTGHIPVVSSSTT